MITIHPEGGLCNRLRSVAAASVVAQHADQPLRVLWYRTPDFNATFGSLFCCSDLNFRVVERWAMPGFVRSLVRYRERAMKALGAAVLTSKEAIPDAFDLDRTVAIAKRQNLYIRSFAKFVDEPDMFGHFVPQDPIQRRVASLAKELERAVAIHVRRTDNKKSAEESPLSAFFSLIDEELERDNSTRFFVATDCPASYKDLEARYGERVFELPKRSVRRDDPAAIADAVADLYALGSCQRIIGSYWSSFSQTASDLFGAPCVIARRPDGSRDA